MQLARPSRRKAKAMNCRAVATRQHRERSWEERLDELVVYKKKNGNCNVPRSHGKLGNWVHNQREFYKKGKLAQERTTQLKGIGFTWGLRKKNEEKQWEVRFNELISYKDKNGNCNVPQSQGKLGKWVTNKRQLLKKGALSQERATQLEGIGFNWGSRKKNGNEQWEERFNELVGYKEKNGSCNVPRSQGALGNWVHKQRQIHKNGKLSQERTMQLEGIGFVWKLKGGQRKASTRVHTDLTVDECYASQTSNDEEELGLPTSIDRNRDNIEQTCSSSSARTARRQRRESLRGITSNHRTESCSPPSGVCNADGAGHARSWARAVTSRPHHYPYDTDEEEELGAAIYQSSNTAREMLLSGAAMP